MRGHDHVRINAQTLLSMAEVQTFGDYLESLFGHKDRQPVDYGECDVEQCPIGMKAVAFHEKSISAPARLVKDFVARFSPGDADACFSVDWVQGRVAGPSRETCGREGALSQETHAERGGSRGWS